MGPGGGLFFLKSASLDPLSGPFSDPTFQEFCRPVVAHGPNTSKKNSKPRGASHVHQWILDDPICRGCSVARFRSMAKTLVGSQFSEQELTYVAEWKLQEAGFPEDGAQQLR